MSKRILFSLVLLLAPLAALVILTQLDARDPESKKDSPAAPAKADNSATPVKPKPLSDNVKKGLAYLINQQHADGGWGQGGGWRTSTDKGGRVEGGNVADPSDLGNTCIAVLALMRAGHTPKDGEYAKNLARAVDFILARVEKADKDSLYVTDVRDTQLQSKIGPYVDTFLAQLVMAELKGKLPGEKDDKRLLAAFDKTMGKIAKHQKADGNFEGNQAWASTLSMALCSKGINRAAQMGFMVPQAVLANDQNWNATSLASAKTAVGAGKASAGASGARALGGVGTPTAAPTDAGVPIYSQSGNTSGIQEAVNTLKQYEKKNHEIVKSKTATKEQKETAGRDLARLKEGEAQQKEAVDGLIRRLDDKQFIQGFGSNGGEEFLSYMNISETLLVRGGKDWLAWDKGITDSLARIQDKDGGWSGHHCITGRTFCTGTALLTLMADRAPVPVVKSDAKGQDKK